MLEIGKFSPNGKLTRVQYATEIWSMAQELSTDYTEVVLVDKLSLHFDWDIKLSIKSNNITTQDKLFELLGMKDKHSQARSTY